MNDSYRIEGELQPPAVEDTDERPGAPIETRTVALVALALIVLPFALYAGAAFFIPLFVSLFVSYAGCCWPFRSWRRSRSCSAKSNGSNLLRC